MNVNSLITNKKGKITKDYDIRELIGKGGFGEVKKVIHKVSNDVRAMKIISKANVDETYLSNLANEVKIMK